MAYLPLDKRGRLTAPHLQRLRQLPRTTTVGVLPASRQSWATILEDARLDDLEGILICEVLPLCDSSMVWTARQLNEAASSLVRAVEFKVEELEAVDAFLPSQGLACAVRDSLIAAAAAGLGCLDGSNGAEAVRQLSDQVRQQARRLAGVAGSYPFPTDVCEAAFGVPYDAVIDSDGSFSASRLLGARYGRYDDLSSRLNGIISSVTPLPVPLLDTVDPAAALVLAARPLVALRTARRVRDLARSALGADLSGTARVFRAIKTDADRSEASHRGMVRVLGQIEAADNAADRAVLTLDLYRRMVESQLRPWAWALLRIRGRSGRKPPEVASLREQLLADGHPLLVDAARAILPAARNASAHEDYVWDERNEMLRVGDVAVRVQEIEAATWHAYSYMAGAEAAWRCLRFSSPTFARLLDLEDPAGGIRSITKRQAITHFGTNGLHVRRWTFDQGVLSVLIDELPSQRINPCFQAAMWASRCIDDAKRVVVKVQNCESPAMDLTRDYLDATFVVWRYAREHFDEMPVSTFLPANACARLAVEDFYVAMRSVIWLALNDAAHAYDDAHEMMGSFQDSLLRLVSRLQLVELALRTTAAVLPRTLAVDLDISTRVVTDAIGVTREVSSGDSLAGAAMCEARLRGILQSLPAASVLPTVDQRPLDKPLE